MPAEFRIVYDEDGYPRELGGEAAWTRAIQSGSLTPDMEVTVYAHGEAPRLLRAGAIPELAQAFGIAAPPPAPFAPPPPASTAVPPESPPAMPVEHAAEPSPPFFAPAAAVRADRTVRADRMERRARLAPPLPPATAHEGDKSLWIGFAVGLLLLILFRAGGSPDSANFVGLLIAAALAFGVYKDANRRGMNAVLWAIFVFFLWIVALPIYLLTRRPKFRRRDAF